MINGPRFKVKHRDGPASIQKLKFGDEVPTILVLKNHKAQIFLVYHQVSSVESIN